MSKEPKITHAQLATKLVMEYCLPAIQDNVQGQSPVKGHVMNDEDRARFGIIRPPRKSGHTILYPIDRNGVFLDLNKSVARVFFMGSDCDKALAMFDAALKKAYPKAKQTVDKEHGIEKGMRARNYSVQLDPARSAMIEVTYPTSGAPASSRKFQVAVKANIRTEVMQKILELQQQQQQPN